MAIKSNPTGIRFDLEKVAFIKQWEKLTSNQQVVDFLMNKYWWEKKVPIPTHKEAPPLNLKTETENTTYFQEPKVNTIKPQKTFQQYITAKRECECQEDWDKLCEEIDNAEYLTQKQKQLIKSS